jgi:biopolymer transport protein ExbD
VKARRQTKPIVETQMVSLADIAFLIIFFFMLTSGFMHDKISVKLPEAPKTAKTESPISVALSAAGKLESRLKSLLMDKKTPKECEVRFRCDKSLTYKDYAPIYSAISNAGGVIAIMHDVSR